MSVVKHSDSGNILILAGCCAVQGAASRGWLAGLPLMVAGASGAGGVSVKSSCSPPPRWGPQPAAAARHSAGMIARSGWRWACRADRDAGTAQVLDGAGGALIGMARYSLRVGRSMLRTGVIRR